MEGYKAYRKAGKLYVDRVIAPMFTMVFRRRADGWYDGKVVDDSQINRFVAQSDGDESEYVAKLMREAGDAILEFLNSNS